MGVSSLDDITKPWAGALFADQKRRSSMLKGFGLADPVKAMTAASGLGGVVSEFGSSTKTLREVVLADQKRGRSILAGLGVDAAAGFSGGALSQLDASTKSLRDAMLGLDDVKRPWADALFADQERRSLMFAGLGLDAGAGLGGALSRAVAADLDGWQETEAGLWVPDTAQLIAATVTAYVALTVLGLYVQELNRLGEGVGDLNRVELLFTILSWLGLQWSGHRWMVRQLGTLSDGPER